VPSAADDVVAAIGASGPIPFVEYMRIALYGPNGFYSVEGSAGRRGDFITSPEVGPLFGTVIAAAIDAWWDDLGRPDRFDFVEVGAGPGTLARAIRAADMQCSDALRYVAVESSVAQRQRHPDGVESVSELPDVPVVGVIFSNELLDNLPFRLFVFDSGWKEAYVDVAPDGSLVEVLRAVEPVPGALPQHAPHGTRLPVMDEATSWVADALSRVERGRLVVIDYCTSLTADLVSVPWREWLRTYRRHERGTHYLRDTGLQDITTQVCVDQLPPPDSIRSQADFMRSFDIDGLIEEGRQYWREHAASPDLRAMKMRSRIAESEALMDIGGLGGFTVAEWLVR
jgi:SAM-dependent MidA family methyltransferase